MVFAGESNGATVVVVLFIVVVMYRHSYTSATHAKFVELSHASASGSQLAFTPSQAVVGEVVEAMMMVVAAEIEVAVVLAAAVVVAEVVVTVNVVVVVVIAIVVAVVAVVVVTGAEK